MKLTPRVLGKITPEVLKSFAEVAGDPNPIHLDESVARAMGLPGVIAHGMLIATWAHQAALDSVRSEEMKLCSSSVKFRAMSFIGDELSWSGEWRQDSPPGSDQPGERILETAVSNQKGEIVLTASLVFREGPGRP